MEEGAAADTAVLPCRIYSLFCSFSFHNY